MTRPLDELIDLTPAMETAHPVTRGTVYNTLRNEFEETDFIAATFAFSPPKASRAGQIMTTGELIAFYDNGPNAVQALRAADLAVAT